MRNKLAAIIMIGLSMPLAGCNPDAYQSTSWNGFASRGYYYPCSGCSLSVRTGVDASASVASHGGLTTVTSSAGDSDAAVATNGVSSAVVASAGGAHAAVGTSEGHVSISTGATSASASMSTDGSTSAGSTAAGTATSSW